MDLASSFGWPYVTMDSGWPYMLNVPGVPLQTCTCSTLDGNNPVSCGNILQIGTGVLHQYPPNFAQRQAIVTAIVAYGASLNPPVKAIFWYDAPLNPLTNEIWPYTIPDPIMQIPKNSRVSNASTSWSCRS